MSNKKQTSVQILVDGLIKLGYLHSNEFGQSPKVRELIKQAKEMHRQEIENGYWDGGQDVPMSAFRCTQYYKENYE